MIATLYGLSGVLIVGCAVLYTAFVWRYSRLRWKRTREGKHLMGQSRVLAVILWGTALLPFLPISLTAKLAVQVALFGWLAFEGARRNYLLTVNQREAADLAAKAFRPHDDV